MCGIAGIIKLDNEKEPLLPHIHRMTERMRHRGPDDEGYLAVDLEKRKIHTFIGDDTPGDGANRTAAGLARPKHVKSAYSLNTHLVLGHRRLKIIDLSYNGHQPMCDETQRFWLVFNGEIYNYKEIRSRLEDHGHTFFSKTDTEVVLRAYMQWHEDCLYYFNGMFAFAVYDCNNAEIFMARDRIGIKPLYYTRMQDRFIFASDIKTIISSGFYRPGVNWEGLWHNFSLNIAPRPMTAFRDVFALPQAHWLRIDLRRPVMTSTPQRYWQIPIGSQDQRMSEDDAVQLLESHLSRSIKYRLEADVEVGTFMSGGIDSTTISAMSASQHKDINAFTLAFEEDVPEYDELDQAIETARMHPMRHIIMKVKPEEVIDNIREMVLGYEEPICILSPNYLISKCIAQHGITVVLNGLGGDELFAGYSHYLDLDAWKWKRLAARLSPGFLLKKRQLRYRKLNTVGNYYADQFSNFLEGEKARLFLIKNNFDTLTVIERLYMPRTDDNPMRFPFSDEVDALSYYDLMAYIGNHHVYRIDQFTMSFSLEGRFPFLDHELIEMAFRIPTRHKVKKNNPQFQKYILRKLAEKYIAPGCLEMSKKGFGLPTGRWMKNQLKEFTETCLSDLKKRDIFDKTEIDRWYDTFKKGSPLLYKKVWHLVMTELWLREFID